MRGQRWQHVSPRPPASMARSEARALRALRRPALQQHGHADHAAAGGQHRVERVLGCRLRRHPGCAAAAAAASAAADCLAAGCLLGMRACAVPHSTPAPLPPPAAPRRRLCDRHLGVCDRRLRRQVQVGASSAQRSSQVLCSALSVGCCSSPSLPHAALSPSHAAPNCHRRYWPPGGSPLARIWRVAAAAVAHRKAQVRREAALLWAHWLGRYCSGKPLQPHLPTALAGA